jgi:hypothetical protein
MPELLDALSIGLRAPDFYLTPFTPLGPLGGAGGAEEEGVGKYRCWISRTLFLVSPRLVLPRHGQVCDLAQQFNISPIEIAQDDRAQLAAQA